MSYVLDKEEEFDRLERQSQQPAYDYEAELRGLEIAAESRILDAGCGSGIVSRYLAATYPASQVIACDASASRIAQAAAAAGAIENIRFEKQDLRELSYPDAYFDVVVSRFVVEHQSPGDLKRLVAEMVRVLGPGGRMLVIDVDGIMHNLYPQTPGVARGLRRLLASPRIDLHVGRKIPYLIAQAGMTSIAWRVEVVSFQGALKDAEIALMKDRFEIAAAFFEEVLGGPERWQAFRTEYLECMEHPLAASYFNKFIVTAAKPGVAAQVSAGREGGTGA